MDISMSTGIKSTGVYRSVDGYIIGHGEYSPLVPAIVEWLFADMRYHVSFVSLKGMQGLRPCAESTSAQY